MLKSVSRLSASVRLLTGQRVHSLSSGGVCFIGSRRTTVRQPPPSREAVNAPAGDVDAATRFDSYNSFPCFEVSLVGGQRGRD